MTQIIANDVAIEYSLEGPADADTVVLIRGLGTQMVEWEPTLIDGLVERGFRVLIFDNRDVGLSQKFEGEPDLRKVIAGDEAPPYGGSEGV